MMATAASPVGVVDEDGCCPGLSGAPQIECTRELIALANKVDQLKRDHTELDRDIQEMNDIVMNDISILLLKTQELNPGSQEADPTCQTSPGTANLLKDRLKLVNYSTFCRTTTEDPPKITQVTQSGRETAHLLNCKPKLTSYSKTRQPPRDNSPNSHQIDANLGPPKTQTYAEVATCLKEVKTKPIFNLANGHQQLPVSRPEGVVQLDYSGDIVKSGSKTKRCLSDLPEQAQPGSAALETPSQDPHPASALSENPNPAKIEEAKSQGTKTLAVRQNLHCHF
ncbi:hypothetical protein DSO57_1020786 [Entomophthora muscae]|uniref:Uncharacterized protein n=1 Tax=Entomophthora muscae TaxID=34485 RepID=A0ACC2SGR0_9FUNG|nr:hypothetical protein DSO57_1020786 [Entomophthora muscae]